MVWLAVAGAIASVIGAFYYLRIVFYMYFGKEGEALDGQMAPVQWVMLVGVGGDHDGRRGQPFRGRGRWPPSRPKRLSAEAVARGRDAHRTCRPVDSTNAEAAAARRRPDEPTWIIAGEQTGGRGRRGRPWSSPRGNFYATLVLHPTEPPEIVALRSFAAALALRDACVALTGLPTASSR